MNRVAKHIQFLDPIRGIAILAVFLFHCLGVAFGRDQLPWGNWFRDFSASGSFLALLPATFGWAGVAIFFVVSGFCIHLSFLRGSPNDWRGFYIRRIFRIYPPYFVALLLFALVWPTTRLSFRSLSDWMQIGSHLLLLHNFDAKYFFGINPAFWSIAVEAQLYLIYPALLALVASLGWPRSLVILGSLEVLMRGFVGVVSVAPFSEAPCWFSGSPFFFWFSWAIGAALADAFVRDRILPFASSSAMVWLVLAVGSSFIKPAAPFSFLFFSVLTAKVVGMALSGARRPIPIPKPIVEHLRVLGLWSFSFYLLHQPVVGALVPVLQKLHVARLHPLVLFSLCLVMYPAIVTISGFFYHYCELRGIAFGKLFLRKAHADSMQVMSSLSSQPTDS